MRHRKGCIECEEPERKRRIKQNYQLRHYHHINIDEYEAMFARQFGLCAICGCPSIGGKSLSVDHCHKSGVIRELLCTHCNIILGHAKDDISILESAIKYLKRHST